MTTRRVPQRVVRDLVAVAILDAHGQNKLEKLVKADQSPVMTPHGEPGLARDLCNQHGCRRVVLCYGDGTKSERTRSGAPVKQLSAMARYLTKDVK